MGQKVNPKLMRLGIINDWSSKWYSSKKKFIQFFHQDIKVRAFVNSLFPQGTIENIEILRQANKITLNIHTSKPGLVIGKAGDGIEEIKSKLNKNFGLTFSINVIEVKDIYKHAQLVGDGIAHQIERRLPYRRVVKAALSKAMEEGVKGIRVLVGGRLNGVEIARREMFKEGTIPLHTFRADIDYSTARANTKYGVIGIKVWIYRGQVFKRKAKKEKEEE